MRRDVGRSRAVGHEMRPFCRGFGNEDADGNQPDCVLAIDVGQAMRSDVQRAPARRGSRRAPATPYTPHCSHLRRVSNAMADSAIAICRNVVACAQRSCSLHQRFGTFASKSFASASSLLGGPLDVGFLALVARRLRSR